VQNGNRYLIALVVALGLFPGILDTSIVVVALTPIRNQLHTDTNTAQWIVTAFFLATAAVVAVGGYVANRFGRKRMFFLGVCTFTIGSLLCGVSPSIGWLIAFRVLQGVGAGILLPVGPALAFDAFPQEQRARASALVGVPIMLAPVFGPMAGGYLTDTFGWHSLFFVNLPIGLGALAAAAVVLPRDQRGTSGGARFDYLGLALSTIGVVAVVYAFKLVTQTNPGTVTALNPSGDLYGWGARPVWFLLGGGMFVLGLFAVYALRISRDPALDVRQLGRRDFLMSNLLAWATTIITFGLLVLVPLYFESVRAPQLSALETGLALMPLGIGALCGTIGAVALYRALGPRVVVLMGVVLTIVSAGLLAQAIHPTANAAQLLAAVRTPGTVPALAGPDALRWRLLLVGLSSTLISIPAQTLALEALTGEALAKASSLVLSTKLVFSSVGAAVMTTLLLDRTHGRAAELVQQLQPLAPGAGTAPTSDPRFTGVLRALEELMATQAGASALQSIFWLTCVGSLCLLVVALLLPGRRRQERQDRPDPVATAQAEAERVAIGS
jgi:EmrB/QacA subfamily drug resistance transporter